MYGIRDVWIFSHNIVRSGRQFVNDALRPLKLSSAEGNILLHLFTQGDLVRQEDIVESLDISKPAVSRALDSLAEKGFVVREKDLSDRRASVVLLTDKAREIGPRVEQIYDEFFSIAAEGVSDEELRAFAHLLYRVSENFNHMIHFTMDSDDQVATCDWPQLIQKSKQEISPFSRKHTSKVTRRT